MKKSTILILLSCFSIIACSKQEVKKENVLIEEKEIIETKDKYKTIEEYKKEIGFHEVFDFLKDNSIEKLEDVTELFVNHSYYCNAKKENIVSQNEVPVYSLNLINTSKVLINTIPCDTEIQIIGHLQQNDRFHETDYFLIKTDNSLFSGWVSEKDLSYHILENELFLFPPVINISSDNKYITCIVKKNNNDIIVISNREGNEVLYIPLESIELSDEYNCYEPDCKFLGWGINSNLVWFSLKIDSSIPFGYIVIDYENKQYQYIKNISDFIYNINYNSGDCLFIKNEKDFVIDSYDNTKMQSITIYYTNIYNQNDVNIVDTVTFNNTSPLFTYGPNNELLYLSENGEYIEYKPNQSK